MTIRRMSREELDTAVGWAAEEGWNPGVHDAGVFYRSYPDGFFAGTIDDEMVASVSLVDYPGDLRFGGFYIVRKDLRGSGIGRAILRFVLESSRERNLGADGVKAMLPTYLQYGFKFAHWNHRFQGWGGGERPDGLQPITELNLDQVVSYDQAIFSAPREAFLRYFTAQEDSVALASFRGGELAGYGVIRECGVAHKIGPLFAEDGRTAEKILRGLISKVSGERFFLDVPEPNVEGMAMAQGLHMEEVFTTARIYTKYVPEAPLSRVFGVTSFELG